MAKGYWLALVDVSDPEGYKAYAAAIQDVLRKFGGRFDQPHRAQVIGLRMAHRICCHI